MWFTENECVAENTACRGLFPVVALLLGGFNCEPLSWSWALVVIAVCSCVVGWAVAVVVMEVVGRVRRFILLLAKSLT